MITLEFTVDNFGNPVFEGPLPKLKKQEEAENNTWLVTLGVVLIVVLVVIFILMAYLIVFKNKLLKRPGKEAPEAELDETPRVKGKGQGKDTIRTQLRITDATDQPERPGESEESKKTGEPSVNKTVGSGIKPSKPRQKKDQQGGKESETAGSAKAAGDRPPSPNTNDLIGKIQGQTDTKTKDTK